MLPLRPDMASLSVGSNNSHPAYGKPPDPVEWLAAEMMAHEAFDLSHIFQAAKMHEAGKIVAAPYVQFVMGVRNAMPADREVFDFYAATVRRPFGPEAPWCAAGIGANRIRLNEWAFPAGGHARIGLEDNVRLDRDTLAPSKAGLVRRTVAMPARGTRDSRAPRGLSARDVCVGPCAALCR